MLALFFGLECLKQPNGLKRYWPALALIALGALIMSAALWPNDDLRQQFQGVAHRYPDAFATQMIRGFFSVREPFGLFHLFPFLHSLDNPRAFMLFPGIVITLLTAALVAKTRWLLFLAAWLAWFYFIFTCKYVGRYYHGWLLPLFLIWTLWLYARSDARHLPERTHDPIRSGLTVLLGLMLLFSDTMAARYRQRFETWFFSGGKDMAMFIRAAGYERHTIASLVCWPTSDIAAYLPDASFWRVVENRYAGYSMWGKAMALCKQNRGRMLPRLLEQTRQSPDLLILSHGKIQPPEGVPLRLLHFSRGYYPFYLYALAPPEPES